MYSRLQKAVFNQKSGSRQMAGNPEITDIRQKDVTGQRLINGSCT
jgi:hypothetical protein